jgi:hypothetical protein
MINDRSSGHCSTRYAPILPIPWLLSPFLEFFLIPRVCRLFHSVYSANFIHFFCDIPHPFMCLILLHLILLELPGRCHWEHYISLHQSRTPFLQKWCFSMTEWSPVAREGDRCSVWR